MLVGRDAELERLRELLGSARAGRSSSVVLAGEPGVGKTALLEAVAGDAEGFRILRTRGVEAEAELSFAALVELLAPVSDLIETLPPAQAAVLHAIAALSEAESRRGEAAAATLALLTAAADESPVLVMVDDAHWLDLASGLALAFAARRARDISLAIVFATRVEEEPHASLEDIERLVVEPLGPIAAEKLVVETFPSLDEATAARVMSAGAGNPLALLELPALVSADDAVVLAEPPPAGDAAQRLFGRRLAELGPEARLALLVAAAARGGDLRLLVPAWNELEIAGAIDEAERSGLVLLEGGRLEFRHPLVRSLAYGEASSGERRRAHAALAAAGRAGTDAEREEATWHAALAATGPDRDTADALAELAARSPAAIAATAYERSARLTPDAGEAARRLLAAAGAAHEAGEFLASAQLASEAQGQLDDELARAEAERLIALAEFERDRPSEAVDRLESAARSIAELAPARAARMLADTVEPCSATGQAERGLELALVARNLARDSDPLTRLHVGLRHSDALHWLGRFPEARALALEAAHDGERRGREELGPEGVHLLAEAFFSGGELDRAAPLARAIVREARSIGALALLRFALSLQYIVEFEAARMLLALAAAEEELELAQGLATRSARIEALGHVAWCTAVRGDDERCRSHVAERFELSAMGRADPIIHPSLAVLELALGRFEEAVTAIEPTTRVGEGRGSLVPRNIAILIEALVQAGRSSDAKPVLERLESDPRVIEDAPSRALAGRCRGLLADRSLFETEFERALEDHRLDEPRPFEEARTRLCYGERLRRERRRLDARPRIREALDAFRRMGATAWERRAEAELAATGERARRRVEETRDELTPQELVVARLVAQGLRNKEVAAQLFLSTNTIETHLRHVFQKLGVRSRTELAARFTDFGDVTAVTAD